jgi:hypothetical protein
MPRERDQRQRRERGEQRPGRRRLQPIADAHAGAAERPGRDEERGGAGGGGQPGRRAEQQPDHQQLRAAEEQREHEVGRGQRQPGAAAEPTREIREHARAARHHRAQAREHAGERPAQRAGDGDGERGPRTAGELLHLHDAHRADRRDRGAAPGRHQRRGPQRGHSIAVM